MYPRHNGHALDVSRDKLDPNMIPDETTSPTLTHLSLRKIMILLAITAVTTFLTVFSAVGAAVARQQAVAVHDHNQHATPHSENFVATMIEAAQKPQYTSCGRHPNEARRRGCKFDISSFSWLTPECFDESLTMEFIQWANWTWYLSDEPGDDRQMSFEDAKRGEQNTFVDWTYHMTHCTFMWRLQHRSIEKGWIGRHLVHDDHTAHCQHSLLMNVDKNRDVRTPARVVYPPCLEVGVEEGMYPGLASRAEKGW